MRGPQRVRVAWLVLAIGLLGVAACSDDEPDLAAFCEGLATTSAPGGAVDNVDLDDPASLDAAIADLDQLVADAPDELADHMVLMRDAFTHLVRDLAAAAEANYDDVIASHEAELTEAAAAAQQVESFARTTCGVDLSPPSEAPTPTPTPLDIQG